MTGAKPMLPVLLTGFVLGFAVAAPAGPTLASGLVGSMG